MEKPKMYQNKIDKVFHNNKLIYMSNNNKKEINPHKVADIKNQINNILNDSSFIYRAKVKLLINGETVSKKIIGLNGNNLVTIDNEYIPIETIEEIYKENKV